jgi:hypothetical protein
MEYGSRLKRLEGLQEAARQRETLLGRLKLADGAAVVVLAFLCFGHPPALYALLAAMALFVMLAVLHERVIQAIAARERVLQFYRRGLARLDGSWAKPETVDLSKGRRGRHVAVETEAGERFAVPEHAYARDLDLFGRGSVFHLLSTARTAEGEATLAGWLGGATPVAGVRARQEAARELTGGLDLREALATVGDSVRANVHGEALATWGERAGIWRGNGVRVGATVLAALWVGSLVCWAKWEMGWLALLMSLVNYGVRVRWNKRVEASLEGLDRATKELTGLAGLLRLIEAREFESTRLRELRTALDRDGIAPSEAVRRLSKVLERLDWRHNSMFLPVEIFLFWSVQWSYVAEGWRGVFGPSVRGWIEAAGEFEALEALAGYAYEHPEDTWPELVEGGAYVRAEGFAHPLLAEGTAVRNDLTLGGELGGALKLVVISGPNMAGKSTFLRALGVNVVLAQAGAPVRARRMVLSPLAVAASISVVDSLESGISRFYAEIRKVKVVSDLADGTIPVLFLLDELLSGTNSHDRFTGTAWIVKSLVERGAIGIVTTHDLALTVIPESMGETARNCHFEDTIEDGRLIFDYRLSEGVVQTSNALELMRSIGLNVDG